MLERIETELELRCSVVPEELTPSLLFFSLPPVSVGLSWNHLCVFGVQLLESLVLQHHSPLFGFLLCVHGGQQLRSHRVECSVPVFGLYSPCSGV